MQDSWILAQAIGHIHLLRRPLASALTIFDSIRSPYDKTMLVLTSSLIRNVDVN